MGGPDRFTVSSRQSATAQGVMGAVHEIVPVDDEEMTWVSHTDDGARRR